MEHMINNILLKIAQNRKNPKKIKSYRLILNELIKMKLKNDHNTNTKGI